jgi:antitoxin VapB
MSVTAKVFKSGNSQAVRIPREYRFADGIEELSVVREDDTLVLAPVRSATFSPAFFRALGALPSFRRPKQAAQRRKLFP